MKVRVLNNSNNPLPAYKTIGSAGMDLMANLSEHVTLKAGEWKLISTGICLELPIGFEAQVRPRSGLALKHGISVLNAPGTIDADYRGDVGVILVNTSQEDFEIKNGDRIAQLVVNKYEQIELQLVADLNKTKRGDGGFGHTGV